MGTAPEVGGRGARQSLQRLAGAADARTWQLGRAPSRAGEPTRRRGGCTAEGVAIEHPIRDHATSEGRANNRRVEIALER